MGWGIEEMREEPFVLFHEPKRFGERGQRHLKEAQGVLEDNIPSVDGQGHDLGAVDDLFREDVLFVEFVQDQVRIKPLGIVSQYGEFIIQGQLSQPIQEILNAHGPFEVEEVIAVRIGDTSYVSYTKIRG